MEDLKFSFTNNFYNDLSTLFRTLLGWPNEEEYWDDRSRWGLQDSEDPEIEIRSTIISTICGKSSPGYEKKILDEYSVHIMHFLHLHR